MQLSAYLNRIRYNGPTEPTYQTLRAIHRAHLLHITYENLDIHHRRYLPLDERHFFTKIVEKGRGGWCYEMNGLFAWALRQLGFDVTLLGSAVNRPLIGPDAEGNHMCLLVRLDQPYLADVGFGNGIREPLPLKDGEYEQDGFTYGLRQDGGRWHFTNQTVGGPGFDFTLKAYALTDFAGRCHHLQTSPESGFVRVTVCHRVTPDGFVTLKGATLRTLTPAGAVERVIEGRDEYERVLRDQFYLSLPESGVIWEKVWRDHLAWAAGQAS